MGLMPCVLPRIRYFQMDLLPVKLTDDFIEKVRSSLPEMPWQKTKDFKITV